MVPFDHEMMTTPWDDFVTNILVGRYHAVHLVAGHDHHFGHKNQGSPELLAQKCAQLGLGCDIIPKVEVAGITVSSTYIRRLVELGQISRANRFLGHPYTPDGHRPPRPGAGLLPPLPHRQPHHPAPRAGAEPRGIYATRATLEDWLLLRRCHQRGHPPHGSKTARTSQWRPVSWTSRGPVR